METKVRFTFSRNEANKDFSVISAPATLVVALNSERTKIWNEVKELNPNIMLNWGQQIWDMRFPNNKGTVLKYEIL